MKNQAKVLTLIECELANTHLINSLLKIGIDKSEYLTDYADWIFDLIKIKKKNRTEALYEKYYALVNSYQRFKNPKDTKRKKAKKILKEIHIHMEFFNHP